MRQKFNYLFIGLLFSGLAFFSYLFLLLYSDFTPQHPGSTDFFQVIYPDTCRL